MAKDDWEELPLNEEQDDWEEISSERQPSSDESDISRLESGVRGAAQGASLGFADEITGGLEAAGDVAFGPAQLSDLVEQYRMRRDESRQAYEAAQEANPGTYLAGEIGGGIAGAVIPGMAAARGVQGAATAAKVLAPAGIKGAAALGGAYGLGSTEADLTEGELGDAAIDTAAGALFGGVTGAVAKGVGWGVGKLKDTKPFTSFKNAKEIGKEGVDIITESGKKAATEQVDDAAKKIGFASEEARSNAGDLLKTVKAKLEKEGFAVDITDEIKQLQELQSTLLQSDHPNAAKDAKKIGKYLDDLLKGRAKVEKIVRQQMTPAKTKAAVKGTREILEQEAALQKKTSELLNEPYTHEIIEGIDELKNKTYTLLERKGDVVTAKTKVAKPSLPEEIIPAQPKLLKEQKIVTREGGIDPQNVPYTKAKDIQNTLSDFYGIKQAPLLATTEGANVSGGIAKNIGGKIGAAPELAAANIKYGAASQALEVFGLSSDDFIRDAASKQIRLSPQAELKLNNVIKQAGKGTGNAENKLETAFKLLEAADPAIASTLKNSTENALKISGAMSDLGGISLLSPLGALRTGGAAAGNVVGQAQRSVAKLVSSNKTLSALADAAQSAGNSQLSQAIRGVAKDPSVRARMAAMTALMANPTEKEEIERLSVDVQKDIIPQTPKAVTGGDKIDAGYNKQVTEFTLEEMESRITPEMGDTGQKLKVYLNALKGKDSRSRNARMHALKQNPAFSQLLDQLRK